MANYSAKPVLTASQRKALEKARELAAEGMTGCARILAEALRWVQDESLSIGQRIQAAHLFHGVHKSLAEISCLKELALQDDGRSQWEELPLDERLERIEALRQEELRCLQQQRGGNGERKGWQ